jgi:hypothetical protein
MTEKLKKKIAGFSNKSISVDFKLNSKYLRVKLCLIVKTLYIRVSESPPPRPPSKPSSVTVEIPRAITVNYTTIQSGI